MGMRWRGGGEGKVPGRALSLTGMAVVTTLAVFAGVQDLLSVAEAVHLPGFGPGDHLAEELVQAALWLVRRGLRRLGL